MIIFLPNFLFKPQLRQAKQGWGSIKAQLSQSQHELQNLGVQSSTCWSFLAKISWAAFGSIHPSASWVAWFTLESFSPSLSWKDTNIQVKLEEGMKRVRNVVCWGCSTLLSHRLGPGLESQGAKCQCKFTGASSRSEVNPALELGWSQTCSLSFRFVPHLDCRLLKSHFQDYKDTQIWQSQPV